MTSKFGRYVFVAMLMTGLQLFSSSTRAGSGPIVALFEMEDRGSGLSKSVRRNLIDYLAARLTEGGYQVVPPDQVRDRLKGERNDSHKTCMDQSCQIELGRELAAQKILSTKILKIGNTCQVTGIMYDLKRGTTDSAATAENKCEVNALLVSVKLIAKKLCAPLVQASKQADDGLAEFEALSKNIAHSKAEKERMEKAWRIVSRIAKDDQVQKDKRVEALEKFLNQFKKKNPYISEAQALLSKHRLSSLVIRTTPVGAQIFVNGQLAGPSPVTSDVEAGKHQISARLSGYNDTSKEITVEVAQVIDIELRMIASAEKTSARAESELTEMTHAGTAGTVAARIEPSTPMHPYTLWGHVSFWSGVGLVGFGGLSYFLGSSADDSYDKDGARMWGGMMLVGFGAGAAAMATGAALWLLKPDDEPANTTAGISPTLDGQGWVFSLSGRW